MMRSSSPIVLTFFVLCSLLSQGAFGQEPSQTAPSNLVGEWKMVDLEVYQAGGKSWDESAVDWRVIITEQSGGMLKGTVTYQSATYKGHDGVAETSGREIAVLGTISWSGDEVKLVTIGEADGSVYRGRIVDPQTIEWVMHEAGEHGWIGRAIAARQ